MKSWKILGGALAIVALVVGSGASWIGAVAKRRTADLERRVALLMAEARSRDPARPVLYGEAVPGEAWTDYDPALVAATRLRPSIWMLEQFLAGADVDRAKLAELFVAQAKAIDGLQAGARRVIGAYPSTWESGFRIRRATLSESRLLVLLAACRARVLGEEGKARDARRLLLDALQFAHDLAHNGFDYGFSSDCYRIALEELRRLVAEGRLGRDELQELETALERADSSLPPTSVCIKNFVLMRGVDLLQEPSRRAFNPDLSPAETWRYGFSDRIVHAEAFDWWCEVAEGAAIDDTGSWGEVRAAHARLVQETGRQKNPLALFVPRRLHAASQVREWRAQLRLLRASARVLAGGRVPDLEDPFGVRLLHSEEAGRLRIWSVGPDGTDDGGDAGAAPSWMRWPGPGSVPPSNKDIVIEVKK